MLSRYLDETAKGESAWSSDAGVSTSCNLLVKLATAGFSSSKTLESNMSDAPSEVKRELLDALWGNFAVAMASMLSPKATGPNAMTILYSEDLKIIVSEACRHKPQRHTAEVCSVLSSGASKCLEIAQMAAESDSDVGRLKQQRTMQLFSSCFQGVCSLDPKNKQLQDLAEKVLSASLEIVRGKTDINMENPNIQASLSVCKTMEDTEGTENLAIAVFKQLCQLVGVDEPVLRQAIGAVLSKVDVGRVLEDSQTRCDEAEQRASVAERQVLELSQNIEKLLQEKAVLEAQLPGF